MKRNTMRNTVGHDKKYLPTMNPIKPGSRVGEKGTAGSSNIAP